ncbi:MAG: exopolyphosphatase [Nitriliruptoraceae bacterium]
MITAAGVAVAAVDVGSNSVRLLVVDAEGARIRRELVITRLAQGVDATGHLDDAALARTLDALEGFRDQWTADGVATEHVAIAATSAVRDAADRDRFFAGVQQRTGVAAEVLSGENEAALAFAGAVGAVDATPPVLVVDIGGGSTELIVGDASGAVVASVSLQLGCVRSTERWLPTDPPTDTEVTAARTGIDALLDGAYDQLAADAAAAGVALDALGDVVAVAGTATTIAALDLDLETYEEDRIHGTRIPMARVAAHADRLLAIPAAERARLGPMQPGREDVIHAGALVLDRVLERFGADVVVSEADSLDGLVATVRARAAERPS